MSRNTRKKSWNIFWWASYHIVTARPLLLRVHFSLLLFVIASRFSLFIYCPFSLLFSHWLPLPRSNKVLCSINHCLFCFSRPIRKAVSATYRMWLTVSRVYLTFVSCLDTMRTWPVDKCWNRQLVVFTSPRSPFRHLVVFTSPRRRFIASDSFSLPLGLVSSYPRLVYVPFSSFFPRFFVAIELNKTVNDYELTRILIRVTSRNLLHGWTLQ